MVCELICRGLWSPHEIKKNEIKHKVGKVIFRIPRIGYVVGALGTPAGQLSLAGLAALLGIWILVVIWQPGRRAE